MSEHDGERERYNRERYLERYLNGGEKALSKPSPEELERVESMIFARTEKPQRNFFYAFRWAFAATAVAAGLALFYPREKSEFQMRGAEDPLRQANVRVFCVEGEKIAEAGACKLSAQLKLAIGNRGEYRYAFIAGVQKDGAPRWYVPRPPANESAEAPRGEHETPFGSAIRLEVNHQPGPLRVFALFSDQPIAMKAVEAAMAEHASSLLESETLPLDAKDVAQRSVLLEVTPP